MNEEIYFKRITSQTVLEVCNLSHTLSKKQRQCVADNSASIAQAHFSETAWFRAIYLNGAPIGFIMLDGFHSNDFIDISEAFLWRFMIAKPYQGKGYGKKAIALLLEYLRANGFKKLSLSCEPLSMNEESPENFYKKLGFISTGEIEDGEMIMIMAL